MSDYVKVPTTPEVWCAIMAAHRPQLQVYGSFSNPDGTWQGGPGEWGEMMTLYSLPGSDHPLIGARTTWDIDTDGSRANESHVYWLCATKDGE